MSVVAFAVPSSGRGRRLRRLAMLAGSTALVSVTAISLAHAGSPGTIVSSDLSINSSVNGGGNGGYLVNGGTLTINNSTLSNFSTTGGAGSGGGAGLGGAIMVDQGGTVVLNDVTLTHDEAVGGLGGTASTTGGSLDDLFNDGIPGATGANGTTPVIIQAVDPSGQPGSVGLPGGDGTDGLGGTGGTGGAGSAGGQTNPELEELVVVDLAHEVADTGDVVHEYAEIANDEATTTDDTAHETDDSAHVEADEAQAAETAQQEADDTTIDADDAVEASDDTAEAATQVVGAAGAVAAEAEFTDAAAATDSAVDDAATAIEDGTQATEEGLIAAAETDKVAADGEQQATDDTEGGADAVAEEADSTKVGADATKDTADNTELEVDITVLAADTVAFEDDTDSLKEWNQALANGQLGIGGTGGNGGTGGTGSAGYGGGLGGAGGGGGAGGYNEPDAYGTAAGGAVGGNGGNGGNGGDGGFGGGGGTGGNGGAPGLGAGGIGGYDGTAVVASGQEGAGGLGGAAGFGGGTGNNGSGYNTDAGQGNGGSGYGGAIFVNAGGKLTINGAALFENNNVIGGDSADGGIAGQAVGTDLFMYADPAGLTPSAAVTLAPGAGQSIMFDGTIADNSVASIGNAIGNVATGSGAGLTVAGATTGVVYFDNLNTYTGATVLQSGVLQAQDGTNIDANSNITFAGGTLQGYGSFIRYLGTASNDVQWVNADGHDGGGFSGVGGGLTVTLNGGQTLTWGEHNFVLGTGATLNFGASTATANVLFTNNVNLEGAVANVADYANPSDSDYAILSGVYANGSMVFGNASNTGVIELTGANTYAGGTIVQDGRLALAGGGSLNPTASVLVDSGAALDISLAGNETTGGLTGQGTIYLGGNTLIVNASGAPVFAGALVDGGLAGGTGGSVEIATGTQVLTGANAYTGATTVDAGADLSMADSGSIALSSGVADNGTFDISSSLLGNAIATLSGDGTVILGGNILNLSNASTSFAGDIENTGALDVLGGTQTLTGVNGFSGQAIIATGATLALAGAGSIGDASAVDSEGVFDISAAGNGGSSITTLLGGGAVNLGANTLTLTDASSAFTGAIAGTGDLVVAAGAQSLGGANSYTGDTTVEGGAGLYITGPGGIASSGDVIDHGTFDISAANGGIGITTLDGDGTANLGANGLTLSNAAGNFAGNIQGTAGLTIGAGTETLSAANGFSGQATVNANAALILTGSGAITGASGLDVNGTADISAAGNGGSAVQTLLGTGSVALGGNTLSLANANTGFGGVISGAGGLAVLGGTQGLSGDNIYTGASTVAGGAELDITGPGGIAESRLVTDDGIVDLSASTAGGARITTLDGNGAVALGRNTLTVTAGSTGFAGAIGGTGDVTVAGGTQSLSGANTYTGATTIAARATLALTGNGTIIDSSGVVDDGTFNIAAINAASTQIATLSGDGAVVLGTKVLDIADESGSFTGTLNGTGMINILAGAFTVPITGGAAFDGTLGVQNSTLSLNPASDQSFSGPVALNDGTVQTPMPTTITQNLVVNGSSTLNGPSGTGSAPTSSNSTVLTGNISGSGTLDTSGNVIDDGSGGNAGGADVQSGTLEVGDNSHPAATYDGNVDVSGSAATLRGHGIIDGSVMNSGQVAPGGSIGTLTVMGNYTQPAAGTLSIEVTPSNATAGVTYSQLLVEGTAALDGGTLALQVDDPNSHDYAVGELYRNVLAARRVTGTFASVTGNTVYDGYVNLTPVYTATAVNLLATATPKAYQSGNAVLDSGEAETIAQLNAASAILDSTIAADGGAATASGAWGAANGGVGGASGGGNVSDYHLETGTGIAVTPTLVLGLAYSRVQTITTLNANRVQTAGDGFYGYGAYQCGQWQLSAVAGGGEANLTDKRELASAGLAAVGAKGESFTNGAIRLREAARWDELYFAPFAQISVYGNHRGGFADGGAGTLDMGYSGYHGAVAAFGAGLRIGYNQAVSGTVLRPWVQIGETGFAGRKDAADTETIGTISAREVSPVGPSALTALSTGVTFSHGRWSGNLSYQGELAAGVSLNTFAASVTYRW